MYPSYSISANTLSDLGVGPQSLLYNSSALLLGLLTIIGTCFLQRAYNFKMLTITLALAGIGILGHGIANENIPPYHLILAFIAFLFGGLSAIFTVICSHIHKFKLLKTPFPAISVVLGVTTLGALILFISNTFLETQVFMEIGTGGIERMIAYPALIWLIGFGAHLIALPQKRTTSKTTVMLDNTH